jgi:hypothetical protein
MLTITEDEIRACMYGTATTGICISCGAKQEGCEPDARKYVCEECGAEAVYGLEEALMEGLVTLGGDV